MTRLVEGNIRSQSSFSIVKISIIIAVIISCQTIIASEIYFKYRAKTLEGLKKNIESIKFFLWMLFSFFVPMFQIEPLENSFGMSFEKSNRSIIFDFWLFIFFAHLILVLYRMWGKGELIVTGYGDKIIYQGRKKKIRSLKDKK